MSWVFAVAKLLKLMTSCSEKEVLLEVVEWSGSGRVVGPGRGGGGRCWLVVGSASCWETEAVSTVGGGMEGGGGI